MDTYLLSNDYLTVRVNSFGAELCSIQNKNGVEYLWNADEKYWKRSSPVLFPIVGGLNNKQYRYNDKVYTLSQHGFARDMDFNLDSKSSDSITFSLTDNENTLSCYPFRFTLQITYTLINNKIDVQWKVKNNNDSEMYFSIGAHPAFMCPVNNNEKQTDYFLKFENCNSLDYFNINKDGLKVEKPYTLNLDNGILKIAENTFDNGVYIVENSGIKKISLLDTNKKPYVTLDFDTQVFGIWSPEKKNAPFICIEPWYGRCDSESFKKELSQREFGNTLKSEEEFIRQYSITIG